MASNLTQLLRRYDNAQSYSIALIKGLTQQQLTWRPYEQSSAIGWHLGHQAAVNHYLVRNLTAAEPSFNKHFDALFDSATSEAARGELPSLAEVTDYRNQIAQSTHKTISSIINKQVDAPKQLTSIATGLLQAVINHEYQHAAWIKEVRDTMIQTPAPQPIDSDLFNVEGYWMLPITDNT